MKLVDKKSFYNLDRKITQEEWDILMNWARNPENSSKRWNRWDVNKLNLNYYFDYYSRTGKNGEVWRPIEKKSPNFDNTPDKNGKKSFFNVGRKLTNEEWGQLKEWRKNNPDLSWRRWDHRENNEKIVFASYHRNRINGEHWESFDSLRQRLDKELEKCRTPEKRAAYSLKIRTPEYRKNHRRRQSGYRAKMSSEQKAAINKKRQDAIDRDPVKKFAKKVRCLIYGGMKGGKSKRTEEILGCTFEEFRIYIENQFEDWMSWDKHGGKNAPKGPREQFDIDHIIPISSAKTEEEVIKLNHYTNLRPFCSYENRWVKSNKTDYEK